MNRGEWEGGLLFFFINVLLQEIIFRGIVEGAVAGGF